MCFCRAARPSSPASTSAPALGAHGRDSKAGGSDGEPPACGFGVRRKPARECRASGCAPRSGVGAAGVAGGFVGCWCPCAAAERGGGKSKGSGAESWRTEELIHGGSEGPALERCATGLESSLFTEMEEESKVQAGCAFSRAVGKVQLQA